MADRAVRQRIIVRRAVAATERLAAASAPSAADTVSKWFWLAGPAEKRYLDHQSSLVATEKLPKTKSGAWCFRWL